MRGYADQGQPPGGEKEPWLLRKPSVIKPLDYKLEASLLVTAADKAHNASDIALMHAVIRRVEQVQRRAGGSAWYLLRMHQQLKNRLPKPLHRARLGKAMAESLSSEACRRGVTEGLPPAVWAAAGYARRTNL